MMHPEDFNFLSWENRKEANRKKITSLEEYRGESKLYFACTQLPVKSSEQKAIIREWISFLSNNTEIKTIFFYSKLNQALFDAITSSNNLEHLFIKWSANAIKDFSKISRLTKLKRLFIGSSTTFDSLSPIGNLTNLELLEIAEQQKLRKLDGIEHLVQLKGLIITGGLQKKTEIEDIEPLKYLSKLEYLSLSSTYVRSENLTPICALKTLRYLDLPIYYDMAEYIKIYMALPNCNHGIGAYRSTGLKCQKCSSGEIVVSMNKSAKQLCTVCDQSKIQLLQQEFDKLVSEYSTKF